MYLHCLSKATIYFGIPIEPDSNVFIGTQYSIELDENPVIGEDSIDVGYVARIFQNLFCSNRVIIGAPKL